MHLRASSNGDMGGGGRRFKIYSVSFSIKKYFDKKDINFHTRYLISSCNKNLPLEANVFGFFDRKELNLFQKLVFSNSMLYNPCRRYRLRLTP